MAVFIEPVLQSAIKHKEEKEEGACWACFFFSASLFCGQMFFILCILDFF